MDVKWSIFIFKVPVGDHIILYNTLNDAMVKLKKDIFEKIDKHSFTGLEEQVNQLKDMHFLLPSNFDEKKFFMNELALKHKEDDHLTITILPTTACNFACPYCYEKGINSCIARYDVISELTTKLHSFLKNNFIKTAKIQIFGGEPTLNWKFVEKIMPVLTHIFKSFKIDYYTAITTNGYLFTIPKARFLQQFNLDEIGITLDGPKEIHDKRRKLKNGEGTFDRIIKNIDDILFNNIVPSIRIRINFDRGNLKKIPELFLFLKNRYGTSKINLTLGHITTIPLGDYQDVISYSDLADAYLYLYKEAYRLGFKMNEIYTLGALCLAKSKNSFIISPIGRIYKCLSLIGREQFIEGDIHTTPLDKVKDYLFPELYEDCFKENCPFIPLCHTGCRAESFFRYHTIHKRFCGREVMEKVNREIIKLLYG